jgi:polysaccharide biosynthesis transport protein
VRELPHSRPQRLPGVTAPEGDYVVTLESQEFRLRDYWQMVLRRRRLVALVFLLVLVLGAFKVSRETRLYTAIATLKIEPQAPTEAVLMLGQSMTAGAPAFDYYQTQFALLRSRVLAASIISKLDLASHPAFRDAPDALPRSVALRVLQP